jgi:hypothetical protein
MHSLEEVGQEADAVRSEIEQLYVRGVAASSAADRKKLAALAEAWERIGAGHVASRLTAALRACDAGTSDAPRALLSAHTSLAVFERVLSLEAAAEAWAAHIDALQDAEEDGGEGADGDDGDGDDSDASAAPAAPAPQKVVAAPPIEDSKGALALVEELARAVEDLVRTGLSSATDSTRAKLDASFKEASRRKLLRLGASLRYVNEEVSRFLANDEAFSMRRFSLFLHRSWLQARGVAKGLRDKDDRLLASLVGSGGGAPRPVQSIEVVTLGVFKRTIINVYTFDFKLRVVGAKDPDLVGRSLTYSLVFPRKAEAAAKGLPAEANLQLPQPQKFTPKVFCLGKVVKITDLAVTLDDRGGGRLMLGPKSTVTEGAPYTAWKEDFRFDPAAALGRVLGQRPGPLDLAAETMEEVVVSGPSLSAEPLRTSEGRRVFALAGAGGLLLDAVIPDNPYDGDGEETLKRLRAGLRGGGNPLLYGLVYYEYGRTILLPLSIFRAGGGGAEPEPEPANTKKKGAAGKAAKDEKKAPAKAAGSPDLFTISDKKFDVSALVGNLF